MKPLLLAVIMIALLLGLIPSGAGANSADSPIATPETFISPIGTPYPTAI